MRTAIVIVLLAAILSVIGMVSWPMVAYSEDNGKLIWRGTIPTARVYDSKNGGQFFNCYPTLWDEVFKGKHVLVRNHAECPEPYKYMSDMTLFDELFSHDGEARHIRHLKNGMIQLY